MCIVGELTGGGSVPVGVRVLWCKALVKLRLLLSSDTKLLQVKKRQEQEFRDMFQPIVEDIQKLGSTLLRSYDINNSAFTLVDSDTFLSAGLMRDQLVEKHVLQYFLPKVLQSSSPPVLQSSKPPLLQSSSCSVL